MNTILKSFLVCTETFKGYAKAGVKRKLKAKPSTATKAQQEILNKISNEGIAILPNFLSKDYCERAIKEIDEVIKAHPEYIFKGHKADTRIYGINYVSDLIKEFSCNPFLLSLANLYNQVPTSPAFTLGAHMPFREGNLGSGEGWHRDAFFYQFKAIVYLTDVTLENGPFQILKYSHKLPRILKDISKYDLEPWQYRFTPEKVDEMLVGRTEGITTCTATAGTVILVDTSCVHRGMPIKAGSRYALTNYYFPDERIGDELRDQFSPLAGNPKVLGKCN